MGKNVLTIDFSGVQDGGQSLIPPGDYVFKITKVEQKTSKKENGSKYLNWTLKGVNGDAKGSTIYNITSLKPTALWNLYNFLVAVGVEVPKKKIKVDLDKVIGKYIGCTIENDEYEGNDGKKRKKSAVAAVYGVRKTIDGKWERIGVPDEEDDIDELDDETLNDIDNAEGNTTEYDIDLEDDNDKQPSKKSKKKDDSNDIDIEDEDDIEDIDDLEDLDDELKELEDALN